MTQQAEMIRWPADRSRYTHDLRKTFALVRAAHEL